MTHSKKGPSLKKFILPIIVITAWLIVAGFSIPYLLKISSASSNDLATFLPKSAESTKVKDELEKFIDSKSTSAIIVFSSKKPIDEPQQQSLDKLVTKLEESKLTHGNIPPPVISEDKLAAFIVTPLDSDSNFESLIPKLRQIVDDSKVDMTAKFTGPAMFARDLNSAFSSLDGPLLFVAVAVVFVILLIVYRSPILPIITLLGSLFALAVAVMIVWFLVKADLVLLNGQVQGILFILVIGATTDYALLYIARYREELTRNESTWEATKKTWLSSWEPIVAAGGTVTAGLLCLLASDLGSNKSLGPVGSIGVMIGIIAALSFLPSALLLFGRRAFWPKQPNVLPNSSKADYRTDHPIWYRIGQFVRKHPRKLWLGFSAILIALALFAPQLNVQGVSQTELVIGESETRDGQTLLEKHFPGGAGSPTLVLAPENQQDKVVKLLDAHPGVNSVSVTIQEDNTTPMPVGKSREEIMSSVRLQVEEERDKQIDLAKSQILQQLAGAPEEMINMAMLEVETSVPSVEELTGQADPFKSLSAKVVDGNVLLQATLNDSVSSPEARDVVEELRKDIQAKYPEVKFGGVTAIQVDTNTSSERDLMVVVPLILLAITIILIILLRSIVAPLILLLTTVISFGSTLGVAALLFNHVLGYPGSDPAVLIFAFVFLVALGIDYNIFLMTRVREETSKSNTTDGTIKALIVTGGVITSAGVVLASTFATLYVIPILFLAQIAFMVSFGVLLDTIIVRSLIVPSLTIDIGKPMWWPSKISRKK